MNIRTFSTEVGGKTLTAEFSDLAENAGGSVILRYGNTAVLATAVMSEHEREGIDYFPLTVDYEERFYAAGQILGSRFMRREGRPSEEAILSGRVVDRTIRPLFPHHIRNEVQVVITVLALDEDDPDVLAVNAASLALATSDIPWMGPVSAVRIGKKIAPQKTDLGETHLETGDMIINPTYAFRESDEAAYDLLACGRDGTINMIEIAAREVSEEETVAALEKAVEVHEMLQNWQEGIVRQIGKEKRVMPAPELPAALAGLFAREYAEKLTQAVFCGEPGKKHIHALKKGFLARTEELKSAARTSNFAQASLERDSNPAVNSANSAELQDNIALEGLSLRQADRFFEDKVDEEIHRGAIAEGKRADNRALDQLRPLYARAGGFSEVLHGTGIFYRGGTHVFTTLTLGGPGDSQVVDTMEEHNAKKRFMHHYNFPPYAPGEVGRMGGINRRAVGHGALAEKALVAVLPPKEQFPYTIRLVSECMASNGSTSMGSVCASTLALMDGGVPISAPVAGIAMGLMAELQAASSEREASSPLAARSSQLRYKVLTDIQGPEDSHGDMDFKIAGTRRGITAIQLDIKLDGVPVPILVEALVAGKKARLQILDLIEKEITAPRADISPRAPKILSVRVRPEQIGLVIGSGGKTINGIKEMSGADDITIEDDGSIFITGKNGSAERAKEMIEAVVKEYKPGEVYDGIVTRLMEFGAFVKIGPSKDAEGLVHVSEVAPFRIGKIADALSVGESVRVMVKEIDEKGRLNLSIKAADPEFAARKGLEPAAAPERMRR
ncbi:MAG: polyribonucleotide nucleotidyltransferase [Minisyncoccia bacterium]